MSETERKRLKKSEQRKPKGLGIHCWADQHIHDGSQEGGRVGGERICKERNNSKNLSRFEGMKTNIKETQLLQVE